MIGFERRGESTSGQAPVADGLWTLPPLTHGVPCRSPSLEAAIEIALDSERAVETPSVPPVRSVPWEGGGSLSAQRTRKL